MIKKFKNILLGLLAVGVAVFAFDFLFGGIEHIEDTNGADNYSLCSIREENIINLDMGSIGGPTIRETSVKIAGIGISSGEKYSAKKFSGVHVLSSVYMLSGSDLYVSLADFEVTSGNFEIFVLLDDEIVGTIEPGFNAEFLMENIDGGDVRVVIAGESAAFHFIAIQLP